MSCIRQENLKCTAEKIKYETEQENEQLDPSFNELIVLRSFSSLQEPSSRWIDQNAHAVLHVQLRPPVAGKHPH